MDKKIDIVIITGFLGAGKTTLMNRLVKSYKHKNIGILVNDFGKVPVDNELIKSSNKDLSNNTIYEIGNGSIFCSCLTADFVKGLQYFIKEAPELLFIETSGLSDPSSMAKLLKEYSLWDTFQIKHVLCVSDSTNVLKLRKHMSFVDRQILSSNTILLNKCDLITEDEKNNISETLKSVNADAKIKFTTFCDFDYNSIEFKEFRLDGNATSCNTKTSAPKRMNLEQIDTSREDFIKMLSSILCKTLRIKGFYKFDANVYYISNNNGKIEVDKCENRETTGITILLEGTYLEEVEKIWSDYKTK